MAEVMIYYTDLESYLDSAIDAIVDPKWKEITVRFKTAILASLTVTKGDEYEKTDYKESLSLWYNKEELPSEKAELLIGPYYIQLRKAFLEELRKIIVEGTVGAILAVALPASISASVPLDFSLKEKATELLVTIFASIEKLNDLERCLYHHLAEHYVSDAELTERDLDSVIPGNQEGSCNMCQFNKNCGKFDETSGRCKYRDEHGVKSAIETLAAKGVVVPVENEKYKFIH